MTLDDRSVDTTPSAYSYPLILKQLLHTPIRYAPDQEIVYQDKVRMTYREFVDRVSGLASGLASLGVGPADTVAVLDWDTTRYLELFFAVPMMGAVLHTVNVRLSPEQILYTMRHAEDTVVLVYEEFAPMLEELSDRLPTVRRYIIIKEEDGTAGTSLPVSAEYNELIESAEASYDFPDFDENRQATLFYTTGTTGNPKGVCFSHRHLMLHTLGVGLAVSGLTAPARFQSGDVYMPLTAMFHVHAWGFPYLATLLGAKQVYAGRFDPERVLGLIEKERVTFSHCVPTILHMLLSHPKADEVDLRGWKINTGGMALPRGLAEQAISRGIDLFHGYGMSETCPILTLANIKPHMMDWDMDRQLDYRTKTGFPVPLVDLRLQTGDGSSVPSDGESQGEIVVRAPWLTQAYLKETERSEELWEGGYLHTGDVANVDPEGYVQITDRLKDAIKSGGEWISSLELESLISLYPNVSEVAVVGKPDPKWGERPVALVVPNSESSVSLDPQAIKEFLGKFVDSGRISKWAVPQEIVIVSQIPKTSVGKLDKKVIRKDLGE